MKHLEFSREYRELLLNGRKKATIRKWTNLKAGDEVYVHCGGKIIGGARIVAVERKKIEEFTDEDAKLDGFRSREELIQELEKLYGNNEDFYLIKFEFRPDEFKNPHEFYYGSADLVEIAEKSLSNLDLSEEERKILEIFLRAGSIRRAANRLGGYRKRGTIRKILRKCYKELRERGLVH